MVYYVTCVCLLNVCLTPKRWLCRLNTVTDGYKAVDGNQKLQFSTLLLWLRNLKPCFHEAVSENAVGTRIASPFMTDSVHKISCISHSVRSLIVVAECAPIYQSHKTISSISLIELTMTIAAWHLLCNQRLNPTPNAPKTPTRNYYHFKPMQVSVCLWWNFLDKIYSTSDRLRLFI